MKFQSPTQRIFIVQMVAHVSKESVQVKLFMWYTIVHKQHKQGVGTLPLCYPKKCRSHFPCDDTVMHPVLITCKNQSILFSTAY